MRETTREGERMRENKREQENGRERERMRENEGEQENGRMRTRENWEGEQERTREREKERENAREDKREQERTRGTPPKPETQQVISQIKYQNSANDTQTKKSKNTAKIKQCKRQTHQNMLKYTKIKNAKIQPNQKSVKHLNKP